MNLKESFRYQKFLDRMMRCACASIMEREHSIWVTKTHKRSEVNPEAEDLVEDVECEEGFFLDDWVVQFMAHLVEEKEKLSLAIGKAKAAAGLDIDAAVETNRCRQLAASAIEQMLAFTARQRTEQGTGYKFNVEGNQTKYVYEIDVEEEEAFDRTEAKRVRRDMISASDQVSEQIDRAMINTVVEYEPPYDVNDTFEDAMELFQDTSDLLLDEEETDESLTQEEDQGQADEEAPSEIQIHEEPQAKEVEAPVVATSVQASERTAVEPQRQATANEAPVMQKVPQMGQQPVRMTEETQAPAQAAKSVPEKRQDVIRTDAPSAIPGNVRRETLEHYGQNAAAPTRTAPVTPTQQAQPGQNGASVQHSQNSAQAQPVQRTQPVARVQTAPTSQGEMRTAVQGQGVEGVRRDAPVQTVRPNQNSAPAASVQPTQRAQQVAGTQTVQVNAPVRPVTGTAQTQTSAAPSFRNEGEGRTAAPVQPARPAYTPPVPPVQNVAAEQVQNEMERSVPDVDRDALDDILEEVDSPEFENPGFFGGQG